MDHIWCFQQTKMKLFSILFHTMGAGESDSNLTAQKAGSSNCGKH